MDSYAILVVIISVLMIIVLALLVAVLVYAIKISKNIKNISVTANQTVEVAKTAALNLPVLGRGFSLLQQPVLQKWMNILGGKKEI